jgi:DNA-binding transcriptional LysR family regulator
MTAVPWNDRTKRRLKLRDLDILMAVLETGSMGKAANRLNISQPAVSKAIVELEDALGVRLLDRSRSGVIPTAYGEALGKRGIAIFNDLRQGVQDIDFLSDPTRGEVRLGTTDPLVVAVITPAIDRMSRRHPGMTFRLVTGDSSTLYRDVLERDIEFAVCRMIGRMPEELAAEVILHDSLAVMTVATNPLARRRKLTLGELVDKPWTLFPPDSFFGTVIADAFRANGYEPPQATATSLSFNMQMELLATGRFLTVLPGFMLNIQGRNPPLKGLPVALNNSPTPVGIITLKNRTLTPPAQLLIEHVRTLAKGLARPIVR